MGNGWKVLIFLGSHKILVLVEGKGYEKPIYKGDYLKKEAETVCRFKEGEGVDTPMNTMAFGYYRKFVLFYSLKWNSLDCIIVLHEGNGCHSSLSYFINIMLC